MKAITIRGVDARLGRALERETKRRGASLNQTVLDVLRQALGVDDTSTRSNGLSQLAGTWSDEELEQFEAATSVFEAIDDELWQ
jgi:hypothetical protein